MMSCEKTTEKEGNKQATPVQPTPKPTPTPKIGFALWLERPPCHGHGHDHNAAKLRAEGGKKRERWDYLAGLLKSPESQGWGKGLCILLLFKTLLCGKNRYYL